MQVLLRLMLSQETDLFYSQIFPHLCSDAGLLSDREVVNGVLKQEAEVRSPKESKFSVGDCEGGERRASAYKLKEKERKKKITSLWVLQNFSSRNRWDLCLN